MNSAQIRLVDDPDLQPTLIRAVGIGELIESNPDMRPSVIHGILRRCETANIIAAAKTGKSFLAGNLAWCIATGTPWLSHDVTQGKVLIIDNELHLETLASRLGRIAVEMMIDVEAFRDSIDVICLRGQNIDIHAIEKRIEEIEPGMYSLVIVDALYRTLPAGTSENDNAAMMAIYNKLDHYASEWDTAIAVVHHASKGEQGGKSVTDVGSGAGSISRAADTHIVIRAHEDPRFSVLECVTRSFKSPEPVSIKFDWPIWNAVAVAATIRTDKSGSEQKQKTLDLETRSVILGFLKKRRMTKSELRGKTGYGEARAARGLRLLIDDGEVTERTTRNKETGKIIDRYSVTQCE